MELFKGRVRLHSTSYRNVWQNFFFKINSFKPAVGLIEAAIGDTLQFELETDDEKKALLITDSLYYDSALYVHTGKKDLINNNTCVINGKKVSYTYTVTSAEVQWLYVLYNDEVIMRYKLDVKPSFKPVFTLNSLTPIKPIEVH